MQRLTILALGLVACLLQAGCVIHDGDGNRLIPGMVIPNDKSYRWDTLPETGLELYIPFDEAEEFQAVELTEGTTLWTVGKSINRLYLDHVTGQLSARRRAQPSIGKLVHRFPG